MYLHEFVTVLYDPVWEIIDHVTEWTSLDGHNAPCDQISESHDLINGSCDETTE